VRKGEKEKRRKKEKVRKGEMKRGTKDTRTIVSASLPRIISIFVPNEKSVTTYCAKKQPHCAKP